MATCTYDNPTTWRRECWRDGRLLCAYDAGLFLLREWTMPAERFFFGANIGDWKEGQLVGDPAAMPPAA